MTKRGWIGILTVIMLGVVIGAVMYAYVAPLPWQETMGEKQAAILNAYSVGEQARVYTKDAAEISAKRTIYILGECESSFEDYVTKNDLGNCSVSKEDISDNFEEGFLLYFEEYLYSFELPSYEEDEIYTLYDVVNHNLSINIEDNKVTIIGYPLIDKYTRIEEDDEGELVEVEYEYESAIEVGSETYNFDYILDPYFKVEVTY